MNHPCITCGTTHDGEFCPKPPQPVLSKDSKPMKNKPAEDAYRVASYLGKLYTRLDVAREAIAVGIDNTPSSFDWCTIERLMAIRDSINREIGLIFDLSKREAHRICNTPDSTTPPDHECPQIGPCPYCEQPEPEYKMLTNGQFIRADDEWFNGKAWQPTCGGIGRPFDSSLYVPHRRLVKSPAPPGYDMFDDPQYSESPNQQLPESSPAENRQLAGSAAKTDSPDDWVTQDLVPDRPGIDQWRWVEENGTEWKWSTTRTKPFFRHGFIDSDGDRFEVRCRRKDLPTQNRQVAASDSPAPPEQEYIKIWFSHAGAIYSGNDKLNPLDRELKHDGKGFFLD